ncbi:hypothetical protein F2Q68_00015895 [Brassica cretica]|uniref:Uncharacterized protein n=1 Tax=Brassica cretica TaxID=69181 RepID=A0A8S9HLH9_BRACR|nr:hypothetical protein F2Q68_00015895 [Brassica cretica]
MHGLMSYQRFGRARLLRSDRVLGRYVATELWFELGRYIATERNGHLVATLVAVYLTVATIYQIGYSRTMTKRSAFSTPTMADRAGSRRRVDSPVSRSDSSPDPGEGSKYDLMAPLTLAGDPRAHSKLVQFFRDLSLSIEPSILETSRGYPEPGRPRALILWDQQAGTHPALPEGKSTVLRARQLPLDLRQVDFLFSNSVLRRRNMSGCTVHDPFAAYQEAAKVISAKKGSAGRGSASGMTSGDDVVITGSRQVVTVEVFPQDGTVLQPGEPSEVVHTLQWGLLRTVSQLFHLGERLSNENPVASQEELKDLKRQASEERAQRLAREMEIRGLKDKVKDLERTAKVSSADALAAGKRNSELEEAIGTLKLEMVMAVNGARVIARWELMREWLKEQSNQWDLAKALEQYKAVTLEEAKTRMLHSPHSKMSPPFLQFLGGLGRADECCASNLSVGVEKTLRGSSCKIRAAWALGDGTPWNLGLLNYWLVPYALDPRIAWGTDGFRTRRLFLGNPWLLDPEVFDRTRSLWTLSSIDPRLVAVYLTVATIYQIGSSRTMTKRSASSTPTMADRAGSRRRVDSLVSRSDSSPDPGEGSEYDLMAPLPLAYAYASPSPVGPSSTMVEEDLAEWRRKYSLPPLSTSVYLHRRSMLPAMFQGRSPFPKLSLIPALEGLLVAIQILGDLEHLSFGINELLFPYHLAPLNGGEGRFHLRPHSGLPIVVELPKSDCKGSAFTKKWQERYVFMRLPGHSYRWNFLEHTLLFRKGRVLFFGRVNLPLIVAGNLSGDTVNDPFAAYQEAAKVVTVKMEPPSLAQTKKPKSGGMATRSSQQSAEATCSVGSLANLNLQNPVASQEELEDLKRQASEERAQQLAREMEICDLKDKVKDLERTVEVSSADALAAGKRN